MRHEARNVVAGLSWKLWEKRQGNWQPGEVRLNLSSSSTRYKSDSRQGKSFWLAMLNFPPLMIDWSGKVSDTTTTAFERFKTYIDKKYCRFGKVL